jgi:hypothetical protein
MKVAHAYGDAGPVNVLLRELVRAAGEERAARIAPMKRVFALPGAWWHTFGRSPSKWRDALQMARTPHVGTGETRPWLANLTVETARSAEVLGRMRVWRSPRRCRSWATGRTRPAPRSWPTPGAT